LSYGRFVPENVDKSTRPWRENANHAIVFLLTGGRLVP